MSNKILIIILSVILLFIVMMGAGFFIMWNKMTATLHQAGTETISGEEEVVEDSMGLIFSLGTFVVNLSDEGGNRYLRVSMDIELKEEELKGEELKKDIEKRLPKIRDAILMIAPTKTFSDLNSQEGKTLLRNQILSSINEILSSTSATNLYFTEFVIQ